MSGGNVVGTGSRDLKYLLNAKFKIEVKHDIVKELEKQKTWMVQVTMRRKRYHYLDYAYLIMDSLAFQALMQVVAFLNIFMLALDHYPIDSGRTALV